ncbi:MAG: hypothetical protein FWF98_00765 [Dehalococcoidia bacterium]|jgi:hypothetical protein|nr:hypothetical protein [Dehalococcoidia bacterium]
MKKLLLVIVSVMLFSGAMGGCEIFGARNPDRTGDLLYQYKQWLTMYNKAK